MWFVSKEKLEDGVFSTNDFEKYLRTIMKSLENNDFNTVNLVNIQIEEPNTRSLTQEYCNAVDNTTQNKHKQKNYIGHKAACANFNNFFPENEK